MKNELASKLHEYLREKRKNESITLEKFQRIKSSMETEKYFFKENCFLSKESTTKKYVLKMIPDWSRGNGVKNEFTIMGRLYKEGIPVPKVILHEKDKTILG